MFGMSHDAYLLLDALVTIIGLIVLITRFKVHPFIALIIAAGFLGLTSGMPVEKIVKSFQDGFGGVLGFVGVILALGTMLGKLMADSGGADQIARTLIRAFGKERVHWSMMLAAFLVGIPLFSPPPSPARCSARWSRATYPARHRRNWSSRSPTSPRPRTCPASA